MLPQCSGRSNANCSAHRPASRSRSRGVTTVTISIVNSNCYCPFTKPPSPAVGDAAVMEGDPYQAPGDEPGQAAPQGLAVVGGISVVVVS